MDTLGQRVKEARTAVPGLSQAELARRVGVTSAAISLLEAGKIGDPAAYLMLGIARQTGRRLEWMLEGRGPQKINQGSQGGGEDAVLSAFRLADESGREAIRQVAVLASRQHQVGEVVDDPMQVCMEIVAAALVAEKKSKIDSALFFRMMEMARDLLGKSLDDDRGAISAALRKIANGGARAGSTRDGEPVTGNGRK